MIDENVADTTDQDPTAGASAEGSIIDESYVEQSGEDIEGGASAEGFNVDQGASAEGFANLRASNWAPSRNRRPPLRIAPP